MRIIVAHNFYQQPGGEDESFRAEVQVLRDGGQDVLTHTVHNDAIRQMSKLTVAGKTLWNHSSYGELRKLVREFRADVVHFNNTFPLISPSAYYACRAEGAAVVQSLRNYRLLCPAATFHRDGQVCQKCLDKTIPWPAVVHNCYRSDRAATTALAAMLTAHRFIGTYSRAIDGYIAISKFCREKFIEAGWATEQIAVKVNCVHPDHGVGAGGGGYALFVGRLSPEKGLFTLLSAWKKLAASGVKFPLKIVGDGPLADDLKRALSEMDTVEWLGRKSAQETAELMGAAECLVFPSEWFETFGRVAVEAFARGTPVIGARIGGIEEIVEHGRTGLLFESGDAQDLVEKVQAFLSTDAEARGRMRSEARGEYEAKYTAERNYPQLMAIYRDAIARAKARQGKQAMLDLEAEEQFVEAGNLRGPH
jgi:glycosyltransferase involved in cell wall biosynthesis